MSSGVSIYLLTTYSSGDAALAAADSFSHRFTCDSLLIRKIPRPCTLSEPSVLSRHCLLTCLGFSGASGVVIRMPHLRSPCWLHDPRRMGVAFELFNEERIVIGQNVCRRQEIRSLVTLLSAQLLEALNVLHHEVLPCQLHVIGKVIDQLIRFQADSGFWLKHFVYACN